MNNVTIRKAHPEEWEKVVDIYRRENLEGEIDLVTKSVKEEFPEIDNNRIIWFAEVDFVVVGVIQLVFVYKGLADGKSSAMLHHLRVANEFQGQGIGSLLIKTAENEARQKGFTVMSLEVEKTNTNAINLYNNLGYTYTKEGAFPNEIILTKHL